MIVIKGKIEPNLEQYFVQKIKAAGRSEGLTLKWERDPGGKYVS